MLTRAEMLQAYRPVSDADRLRVGFEYESQCFDATTLRPANREQLVQALKLGAELLSGTYEEIDGESRVELGPGRQLSLEPGGQLEFSSAPVASFSDCLDEVASCRNFLEALPSLGLHVFHGGVNPVHSIDEIGLVSDKARYQIMDQYFPRVGTMGRRMMRQSASIQVTFDYREQMLGEELLRTAFLVSPFAAALFCNSPFVDGQRSAERSFRAKIWQNTDPKRSGLPPNCTQADYSFDNYLDYVVQAPMFFFRREGRLVDAQGASFAELNRNGLPGRSVTYEDFLLHNSTMFCDVRLKRTVEVRSIDAQDPQLLMPAVTLLCGLLLCSQARSAANDALGSITEPELRRFASELGRDGLTGKVGGRQVRDIVLRLLDVAEDGVLNCFADGKLALEYLRPIRQLAEMAYTPADIVLERFDNAEQWLRAGRTFAPGELK